MAFMIPQAEFLVPNAVYDFRALCSRDCDPELDCGDCVTCGADYSAPLLAGWYARLSAPGYLDCTEWNGPFHTEAEALASVCEFYGVDANGDDVDDVDGPCVDCDGPCEGHDTPADCAECERSNGPHYTGPCEHSEGSK